MRQEDSAGASEPRCPAPNRDLLRTVWKWTRIALVVAMLAGLVVVAQPRRLVEALAQTQLLWALAAVPWAFVLALLDTVRLHWLMLPHGYRQGWRATLRTNLVVNFVSQFLPGTVGGGAVSWYRLARPDALHMQTLSALALNTLLKFIALSAVGAGALAWDARRSGVGAGYVVPLAVCAILPAAALALLFRTSALDAVRRAADRLPWTPQRVRSALQKLVESGAAYRKDPGVVALAVLLSAARVILQAAPVLLCMAAVGLTGIPYARVVWIMCAVEASGMLPFTLSGLGLPQVTFVGLLAAGGAPEDKTLAANIVSWAALIPLLLTGAAVMAWESLRGRKPPPKNDAPGPPVRSSRGVTYRTLLMLILLAFLAVGAIKLHASGELAPMDTNSYFANARAMRACGGFWGAMLGHFTGAYTVTDQRPLYLGLLALLPDNTLDALAWAKALTLALSAAAILIVYLAARPVVGRPAALLATALLAINSAWIAFSTVTACETLLALWVTLAWLAMTRYLRTGRGTGWIGLWCGLACMTKISGLFLLPAALGVVLWKERVRALTRRSLWTGILVGLLVCSPLLVRALRATRATPAGGLSALWVDSPGQLYDPDPARRSVSLHDFMRTHTTLQIARRFLRGCYQEGLFTLIATGETWLLKERFGFKVWPVGLLILLLAGTALWRNSLRPGALTGLAVGAVFLAFFAWFVFDHIRFMFPMVPILLFLGAAGGLSAVRRLSGPRWTQRVAVALCALLAGGTLVLAATRSELWKNPLDNVAPPEGYAELFDWISAKSATGAPGMMGPSHTYSYFWTDRLSGRTQPLWAAHSPEQFLEVLRRHNIQWLVVDDSNLPEREAAFHGWVEPARGGLRLIAPPRGWRLALSLGAPARAMTFERVPGE